MAKLVTKPVEKKNGKLEWLENRKWILPAVFSIIIFTMAIWGIGNFNQLLLYDDEFGYWAASAYLTGTDWTSVTSGIPYYSYGYGFLVLTPIRLLFSNTEMMYKAAIVVNALLLVGSYWIARNVTKQLFEKAHWALIDAVCFVVMLYPSNIVFSHITWAECLLVFWFWVFTWLSLRVVMQPSVLNHVGMAVTVIVMYVVHQRTLSIIIATSIVMIYLFFTQKKQRKAIIAWLVTLIILLVIHSLIKNDLLNDYYNNNVKIERNNMEGQLYKIASIFSINGFTKIILSMLGKWFYLLAATGMMIWWAFKDIVRSIFSVKWKEYCRENADDEMKMRVWKGYMMLCFLGAFMITCIFTIDITRNDNLLYGRYNEYLIGLFIIIGVFSLLKDEKAEKGFMIQSVMMFVSAWICQLTLEALELTTYQPYHSVATSLFLEKGKGVDGRVLIFWVCSYLFALTIFLFLKSQPWEKFNILKCCCVVMIPVIVWTATAFSMIEYPMGYKQILRTTSIKPIVTWIETINYGGNVYYLDDTESRYWSESFQFLLKERPLLVIETNEIDLTEDAYYIASDDFLGTAYCKDNFVTVKKTSQFSLVVKKDGTLAERVEELKK